MKKLNFSELAQEMEVLSQEETRKIKGGYDDVAFSVTGDMVYVYDQSITWDNSDLYNVYGGGGWYVGGGTWGDYNGGGGCPIPTSNVITENSVTTVRDFSVTTTEIRLTQRDGLHFFNSAQDGISIGSAGLGVIPTPYYLSQLISAGNLISGSNWGSIETKYINSNSQGLVVRCVEMYNPYGYGIPSVSWALYTADGDLLGVAN